MTATAETRLALDCAWAVLPLFDRFLLRRALEAGRQYVNGEISYERVHESCVMVGVLCNQFAMMGHCYQVIGAVSSFHSDPEYSMSCSAKAAELSGKSMSELLKTYFTSDTTKAAPRKMSPLELYERGYIYWPLYLKLINFEPGPEPFVSKYNLDD